MICNILCTSAFCLLPCLLQVFVSDGEGAEPLGARFAKASFCATCLSYLHLMKTMFRMLWRWLGTSIFHLLPGKTFVGCKSNLFNCWIRCLRATFGSLQLVSNPKNFPVQEKGTLPSLRAVVRCGVHSATRALENSLAQDPRINQLIGLLVNNYSSGDGSNAGGLARAIRNSPKLQGQLADVMGKLVSWGFAPQRFGTLCDCATAIILNVKHLFALLINMESSSWSQKILEAFKPKSLLLLALTAELSAAAMRFVRQLDKGEEFPIAQTGRAVQQLEKELGDLFNFQNSTDPDGSIRQPLVLNEDFTSGFVQILIKESPACRFV